MSAERGPEWRITARRVEASFRVFDVEKVSLARGDAPRRDAYVFRTRDWCNVLAVTPEDDVLFVRQFRFGTATYTLELPGGVMDDGEEPAVAAARELAEETGYIVDGGPSALEPLVSCAVNPALQTTRIHTFFARAVTLSPVGTAFDDEEECELIRIPRTELALRVDRGDIDHSLCRLPIETYLRRHGTR